MTITFKTKTSSDGKTIVALEWEKQGLFYIRVYENMNIFDWKQTHESRPYLLESEATKAYYRYKNKYISE